MSHWLGPHLVSSKRSCMSHYRDLLLTTRLLLSLLMSMVPYQEMGPFIQCREIRLNGSSLGEKTQCPNSCSPSQDSEKAESRGRSAASQGQPWTSSIRSDVELREVMRWAPGSDSGWSGGCSCSCQSRSEDPNPTQAANPPLQSQLKSQTLHFSPRTPLCLQDA